MTSSKWKGIFLALVAFFQVSCKETVLHNLDEVRANQVKVTLEKRGITAQKLFEGSGWSIRVKRADETEALSILEESRVLKRNLRTPIEPPKGLIPSREERASFSERQLAASLESTLERLPYVLEARVHLNLNAEENLQMVLPKEGHTGSALIVTDDHMPDHLAIQKSQVQQLIAGASGVNPQSISVVIAKASAENYAEPQIHKVAKPVETTKKDTPSHSPSWIKKLIVHARQYQTFLIYLAGVLIAVLALRLIFRKNPFRSEQTIPSFQMPPLKNSKNTVSSGVLVNGTQHGNGSQFKLQPNKQHETLEVY